MKTSKHIELGIIDRATSLRLSSVLKFCTAEFFLIVSVLDRFRSLPYLKHGCQQLVSLALASRLPVRLQLALEYETLERGLQMDGFDAFFLCCQA